jgi:integrase/recombinase XerD
MATKRRSHGQGTLFKRNGRGPWIASWHDHTGKRLERSTRTTDKSAAERILSKRVADAALRREGVIDAKADQYRAAEARPLAEHIEDFRAVLLAKGNTTSHVNKTVSHVRRIADLCHARHLGDLTSFKVQSAIGTLRGGGLSLRTCNAVLRSAKTFAAWLHRDGRWRENALVRLSAFNADTDRRYVRRDVTPDELHRLIAAAQSGPIVMGMPGPERAMAYRLAVGTGFRASELASLTLESFNLDGSPPTVSVVAAYSKRRRDDVQPIRDDLAALLRPWLNGKPTGVRVICLPDKTAKMIRFDLEAAGIPCRDSAGRVIDFHSLRHSYISQVVNSGASVKVAQELARHSTPTLTIGRYAHTRLHDLSAALSNLPDTDTPGSDDEANHMRATGTEGRADDPQQYPQLKPQQLGRETVRRVANGCENEPDDARDTHNRNSLHIADKHDGVQRGASGCGNGSSRIRTRDRGIMSPQLYH